MSSTAKVARDLPGTQPSCRASESLQKRHRLEMETSGRRAQDQKSLQDPRDEYLPMLSATAAQQIRSCIFLDGLKRGASMHLYTHRGLSDGSMRAVTRARKFGPSGVLKSGTGLCVMCLCLLHRGGGEGGGGRG